MSRGEIVVNRKIPIHSNQINQKLPEKYECFLAATSDFIPLQLYIKSLWVLSSCELQFLSTIERISREFKQYSRENIHLLEDELLVSNEKYGMFIVSLDNLIKELIAFKPMSNFGQFTSTKNGKTYNFSYEYDYSFISAFNAPSYRFKIFEKGREDLDYFSFQLREMENGKDLKVVDLYPDRNQYYLGKGISISIILESSKIFQKRIISSSNKHKSHSGEYNSQAAIEKVWKKLVASGKAAYNKEKDYYFLK